MFDILKEIYLFSQGTVVASNYSKCINSEGNTRKLGLGGGEFRGPSHLHLRNGKQFEQEIKD